MVMSTIKKGLILGLALAKLTKDEAATTVRFLIKEGNISQKEGRKMIDQIMRESEKEKRKIKGMIKQKMLTDKEMAMLKKEMVNLRKTLGSAARTGRAVAGSAYRRLKK